MLKPSRDHFKSKVSLNFFSQIKKNCNFLVSCEISVECAQALTCKITTQMVSSWATVYERGCVCVCVCVCACECVFLLSYPLPIQSLTHTYEDIRNVYAWGNFVIATALSCLFPNLSLFFLIYFRFFLFHSFFLSRSHFRLFAQKLVHKRLSPSSQRFRSGLSLALVPLVQNVPAGA